jgi:hypothetical protein
MLNIETSCLGGKLQPFSNYSFHSLGPSAILEEYIVFTVQFVYTNNRDPLNAGVWQRHVT